MPPRRACPEPSRRPCPGLLECLRRDERRDRRGPAARNEELLAAEQARPQESGGHLRVVPREVENDVRIRVALDDVTRLGVVACSCRVVEERSLDGDAGLLERGRQRREQPRAERIVAAGERDSRALPHLLHDQFREDRSLHRIGRHGAEVVAVVGERRERRARVVRPDLHNPGGNRRRSRHGDGVPRRERPQDATGAVGDHFPGRGHGAVRRRSVVRVLDLDLDVRDSGLPQRLRCLLHCEACRLRVRRAVDRRDPGERNDIPDAERVTRGPRLAVRRGSGRRAEERDDGERQCRSNYSVHSSSLPENRHARPSVVPRAEERSTRQGPERTTCHVRNTRGDMSQSG